MDLCPLGMVIWLMRRFLMMNGLELVAMIVSSNMRSEGDHR